MAENKEINTNSAVAKEAPEVKKNRLKEVFTKEYKHEGLFLSILAIVATILGTLILTDVLPIDSSVYLIGGKPNSTIFAWVMVVLGVLSLVLCIWPYYKPSIYEVKMVSWPTKKNMITDCISVLVYSAAFALFFFVADIALGAILKAIIK